MHLTGSDSFERFRMTGARRHLLDWLAIPWMRWCLFLSVTPVLMGCTSTSRGFNVFAPYRGSAQPEEMRSPPPDDPRFTQAPSYPSHLLKPVVKVKDEETGTGLRRAPIGAGMGGPMGGAGGPGF
ncbi:MAG: hypothetical protein JNJ77_13100 [Planctomycetia bacterium]|nr:hypothetical protein [Planctomycetia bacterium]